MRNTKIIVGVFASACLAIGSVHADNMLEYNMQDGKNQMQIKMPMPFGQNGGQMNQGQGNMMQQAPMGMPFNQNGQKNNMMPMGPQMGSGQFMGSGKMMPPKINQGQDKGQKMGSGQKMEQGPDFLRGFVKADLTEDEKEALKKLLDANKTYMESLMQTIKASGTQPTEEQLASIKAAQEKFVSDLSVYIDTTKLEAFKKSLESMKAPANGNKGQTMEKQNGQNMQQNMMQPTMTQGKNAQAKPTSKYSLSEKTKAQLNTKLDSIPAEKQQEFFSKVISKIDVLLAKVSSEKLKTQLKEIKDILQEKLDTLNGNTEENIINELISDN